MKGLPRKAGGILLIVAGLVAIPVPILPGLPLIAAGAALLAPGHPAVRMAAEWLRSRGL